MRFRNFLLAIALSLVDRRSDADRRGYHIRFSGPSGQLSL